MAKFTTKISQEPSSQANSNDSDHEYATHQCFITDSFIKLITINQYQRLLFVYITIHETKNKQKGPIKQ